MADRYDSLAPQDLITTLRSLRRRFGAVAGPLRSDPELFERIDEPGPDGRSMGDILSHTAERVETLSAEAMRFAVHTEPTISGAALHPADHHPPRQPIESAVASIERNAEALAATLDHQDADSWTRDATVDTGGQIDLVTLVRGTVREAIEGLRAAEKRLEQLN